jgi:hypothetical protein
MYTGLRILWKLRRISGPKTEEAIGILLIFHNEELYGCALHQIGL